MKVMFYTTTGCSRCEHVLDGLFASQALAGLTLEAKDIAYDESLLKQFGETIPVLSIPGAELHSPFTVEEAITWLTSAGQSGEAQV